MLATTKSVFATAAYLLHLLIMFENIVSSL